ncbi:YicC/YloC family endoribonuclease [Palleronia abyssalis]|uniref:YicC family protein n=1 Tax=Palleronia abyssalis TaxID=1501240 RepID=A0A2R8BQ54_9RHOB|nr:YicC/YloC family endoribonuclease [Palleronia abyssalis]SPJ22312.1 hypothetical protein PAA8504_00102 [Palleronia abyssalis]
MTASMTGFASETGAWEGWTWGWEMRSVNGKGLDLRLRVPDWIGGLETGLRQRVQAALARGNVTVSLRLTREAISGGVDRVAVETALTQISTVEAIAAEKGRPLAPVRAIDILQIRTAPESLSPEAEAGLRDTLIAQFEDEVLPAFVTSRLDEGRALDAILMQQLDRIGDLVAQASTAARDRQAGQGDALRAAIARIAPEASVDPDRLAQELALLAVKQDVTEELDRLCAHVAAAKAEMRRDGPKGRKLDFLMQEFNREANTLCSKSQDAALTAIGLDLKTVIDQLREQVQNVE